MAIIKRQYLAVLDLDILEHIRDNYIIIKRFVEAAGIPAEHVYRKENLRKGRMSSLIYGSLLHQLGWPLNDILYYEPINPEKTTWGTHFLRINQQLIQEKAQAKFGIKYVWHLTQIIQPRTPSQVKNFFIYHTPGRRTSYDRELLGSLMVIFGLPAPPPFRLLKDLHHIEWRKNYYGE
jgi:hypothetical protein